MGRSFRIITAIATAIAVALGPLPTLANGVTATYAYQPDGLRLSKTVGDVKTTHVWDGGQMVAELNASNAVTARYIRGAGGRIVSSLDASGAAQYYLHNVHGDVAGLTDASGTLAKTYRYDAFGGEANPAPTDPNPFRYAGEYFDNVELRSTPTLTLLASLSVFPAALKRGEKRQREAAPRSYAHFVRFAVRFSDRAEARGKKAGRRGTTTYGPGITTQAWGGS